MGFPSAYSEFLFPKFIVRTISFIVSLRRLIATAFHIVGLDVLVEQDVIWPDELIQSQTTPAYHSVSAMLIREILPVVQFHELSLPACERPGSCAVCLAEFEGGDEVPRLVNCRHVFHRGCLDRWLDHEQKTCPLCRAQLIPHELRDAFNDKLWAAAAVPDSYYGDLGGVNLSEFN